MSVKLEVGKTYLDGDGNGWTIRSIENEWVSLGRDPFGTVKLFMTANGQRDDGTAIRHHLVKEYKEPRFVYTSWQTYAHLLHVVSQTYSSEKEAREHPNTVALVKINLDTYEVTPLKV